MKLSRADGIYETTVEWQEPSSGKPGQHASIASTLRPFTVTLHRASLSIKSDMYEIMTSGGWVHTSNAIAYGFKQTFGERLQASDIRQVKELVRRVIKDYLLQTGGNAWLEGKDEKGTEKKWMETDLLNGEKNARMAVLRHSERTDSKTTITYIVGEGEQTLEEIAAQTLGKGIIVEPVTGHIVLSFACDELKHGGCVHINPASIEKTLAAKGYELPKEKTKI